MNVLSLFDGISCGRLALEKAGITIDNYYASEIDNNAIRIAQKNFPSTTQLGGIEDIDYYDGILSAKSKTINVGFLGGVDLLIGGSPCQDLSCLKDGEGLEGNKSKLLYDYVRLLRKINPTYFLLENVVPRKKEWKDKIDELMGVEGVYINSDLFVPQNRPRVYWTNLPLNNLPQRPNWTGDYYQYRRTYFRKNQSGVCPCLTANMGTGGHNVPLKSENLSDRLTINELEALQGLPIGYVNNVDVANCHKLKGIGNGWTIDVIAHLLNPLANHIKISKVA